MGPSHEPRSGAHEPVLMDEVMEALCLKPSDTALDATLGGAGHFGRILGALGGAKTAEGGSPDADASRGVIIGIDADPDAVERARESYAADRRPERPTAHLVNDNFRNLSRILERLGIAHLDAALFDLGWSGYQLTTLRGFSFTQTSEPLLMTYSESTGGETAAAIVNGAGEAELADILARYGEERFARAIARELVKRRGEERILTVGQLVEAVEAAVPAWYRERRVHPATKTFQALRIATNDEIGALREGISAAIAALSDGGRLAVITFHSVEDRAVKQLLREAQAKGAGEAAKKAIAPTREEVARNRRARSAKLRVFTKRGTGGFAPDAAMRGERMGHKSEYGETLFSYV